MNRERLAIGLAVITLLLVYGLFDPSVWPFPKCPFLSLTGWQCPGCGSQRAIYHALHGSFGQAFKFNPMFLPALSYALFGYSTSLFFPGYWPGIRDKFYGRTAAWIILLVILSYWIARNVI